MFLTRVFVGCGGFPRAEFEKKQGICYNQLCKSETQISYGGIQSIYCGDLQAVGDWRPGFGV